MKHDHLFVRRNLFINSHKHINEKKKQQNYKNFTKSYKSKEKMYSYKFMHILRSSFLWNYACLYTCQLTTVCENVKEFSCQLFAIAWKSLDSKMCVENLFTSQMHSGKQSSKVQRNFSPFEFFQLKFPLTLFWIIRSRKCTSFVKIHHLYCSKGFKFLHDVVINM